MTAPTRHPPHDERRRSPRVNIGDRVAARVTELAQDVIIRDLSLGGFLIESPQAFPPEVLHQFRVASKDGAWTTVLTAKSLHSRPRWPDGDAATFLTGFAFVDPQGLDAQQRIRALVNQATSVVSY